MNSISKVRGYRSALALAACALAPVAFASVDLGIADDETYKRPNAWALNDDAHRLQNPVERLLVGDSTGAASRPGVSIAWRNANQVEEVEVRVQNLGDEAGEGAVTVDILDESGKSLLSLAPPDDQKIIRVPAFTKGGKEGKILRMKASWELNALIDRFDLTRTRYHVRATVTNVGSQDANLLDNAKVKSWNMPTRVVPGNVNAYNYAFANHTDKPVKVRWMFEHTPYPPGWKIDGAPDTSSTFELPPGRNISGTLSMKGPPSPKEGDFVEARLSLVDTSTGTIFMQNEWFQIYDTKPPEVTNYRTVLMDNGQVAIQALVSDMGSGILEATGVSTQYSVDDGKTWARKAHNYKVGNFVTPTLFETVLGPFRKGTKVQLRFTALDTAGNAATILPSDAVAFQAPPNAHVLLQNSYLFPRTAQNPIFEIDKLRELQGTLAKLKKSNIELRGLDFSKPNAAGVDPKRLAQLGITPQRFDDLVSDLDKLQGSTLDFSKIKEVPLRPVGGPIDKFLNVSTVEITAK